MGRDDRIFDVYLAIGANPDHFQGSYDECAEFLMAVTTATDEELKNLFVDAAILDRETTLKRDDWVVSVTSLGFR